MNSNDAIIAKKEKHVRQYIYIYIYTYIYIYIYTNQGGHLPTKVTPDIDFADEPVALCDVTVQAITFVDD